MAEATTTPQPPYRDFLWPGETYGRTCAGLPDDTINFLHDPLACAIALGWDEGIEVEKVPLKLRVVDGWLHEDIHENGTPFSVVTRVDGREFSEFWLRTIVGFG